MTGRRAMLVVVALTAIVGVFAGLDRLGWPLPFASRAMDHGPLMILGVFGTVIALERAVALGRWAFAAPVLGAASGALLLAGLPRAGAVFACAMALALAATNFAIVRRQPAAFTWLMLLGSAVLLGGTLAWALGRPIAAVAPAWLVFFALTIVAERLELSRLAPKPRWATAVLVGLGVALALAALAALGWPHAVRLAGAVLILIGAWELRFDLARRTIRLPGLPRFSAAAVLVGAFWLAASGAGLLAFGLPPAGPVYDAVLHAVFVGFVLSMVFAHAPIILPAVARLEVPFHPVLYLPLGLLHVGLAMRVAGDLADQVELRRDGALINALSIALFALAVVLSRLRARLSGRTAAAARFARPTAQGRTSDRAPS